MSAALRLQGVVKKYGRRKALNGLDITVPEGLICGLVGRNGAGKTTAMAVAGGLVRPYAGQVDVLGDGPFSTATHAGRVALIPQDADFPRYARVAELLNYYGRLQGHSRADVRRQTKELLQWVHLSDRAGAQLRTLSHGMRRRVMIAQAFVGRPELVLLDEPMAGLDPQEVRGIRHLLKQRAEGQTVVVSSHNLDELQRLCDYIIFMDQGRCTRSGQLGQLLQAGTCVRYHLSSPAMLEPLQAALPDLNIQLESEQVVAVVGVSDAAAVNARILPRLLEAGVGIMEISSGQALEEAFLSHEGEK